MLYNAYAKCATNDAELYYKKENFKDVNEATDWLTRKFAWFMRNWALIDENGIVVFGEVCDKDEEHFSDMYEIKCGM